MEKRELTRYLSEETVARLTEEAFSFPAAETGKRKTSRLLALAACLALVVAAVNFDTVYAAVREFLYFFPGSGAAGEETASLEYWLPTQEYAAATEAGEYFVSYLYRRGDVLSLRVEKKVSGLPKEEDRHFEEASPLPEGEDSGGAMTLPYTENGPAAPDRVLPELSIAFRDENGAELDLPQEERRVFAVHDETKGTAVFAQELEMEDFIWERFTLVLDGEVEFPVELFKADPESYALSRSVAASCAGYRLSLLPLNENGTRFALIPAPEADRAKAAPAGSYWEALWVEAIGESGTVYQAENVNTRPGCQEFYIPGLPEERMVSVSAGGILESTRYEKPPAAIKVPALEPGEEKTLDQRIDLGNIVLLPQAAGLTPEGELWVRLAWEGEEGRRLNQVDLRWPDAPKETWISHNTLQEGAFLLSHNGMAAQAGKRTSLPVTFLSLVQEGEWSFPAAG